jgi:hypothetical protein
MDGCDGVNRHTLVALQADAQLAIGKPEAALESVAAALKAVENMGGAALEAELWRLGGEALLAGAGTASEAETAIEQGIDVARRQNAKSWELRAAMSLARLRRQQGRQQEAVALLAPIYAWFTEASTPPTSKPPAPSSPRLLRPPGTPAGRPSGGPRNDIPFLSSLRAKRSNLVPSEIASSLRSSQ